MKPEPSELDQALQLLKESTVAGQRPNRYHARAILLPLGAGLAAESAGVASAALKQIAAATLPVQEAWREAVEDEIEMAVTEFVHATDPRYLGRKDYDLAYTLEARARVEDRLRAVRALGLVPDPTMIRQLAQADQRLEARRGPAR